MKDKKMETINLDLAFNWIQRDDARLKLVIETDSDVRDVDISDQEHQLILMEALFDCIKDNARREHDFYMNDIERIKKGILGYE